MNWRGRETCFSRPEVGDTRATGYAQQPEATVAQGVELRRWERNYLEVLLYEGGAGLITMFHIHAFPKNSSKTHSNTLLDFKHWLCELVTHHKDC